MQVESLGISSSSTHDSSLVPTLLKLRRGVFQGRHAVRNRVIGPLTVIDQNQRRLSAPPRVWCWSSRAKAVSSRAVEPGRRGDGCVQVRTDISAEEVVTAATAASLPRECSTGARNAVSGRLRH